MPRRCRSTLPTVSGASRPLVLIADADPDLREQVRTLLRSKCDVVTAENGEAARAMCTAQLPDLVIADEALPGVDGRSLLRSLRADVRSRALPMILLSVRGDEEDLVAGLAAGADAYLGKPFGGRELVACVESQLRLAALRRQGELRLREFVDAAPAMLRVTDRDNHATLLSRGLCEFIGQSEESGLGRGWLHAVHADDVQEVERTMRAAAAQRAPFRLEYRVRRADGAYRWVADAAEPRFRDDGEWLGFIGSVIDITDRKHFEQELMSRSTRLRLLWEAAEIVLVAADPDQMLHRLFARIAPQLEVDAYFNFMLEENGRALRLMSCAGIDEVEARAMAKIELGQAICGRVAELRRPLVANAIQDSREPHAQAVRDLGLRAYACNPLLAGDRLLGTLGFGSRTRDRFEADELEFFETIARYVTAAYRQQRSVEELREADRRKDEFLATLAHEVRNPLMPLRFSLEVMRVADFDRETTTDCCQLMERQVGHLTRLVDDLLEVSRITRGKLELKRCHVALAEIVRLAVESMQGLLAEAGHRLTVHVPPEPLTIDADPLRLVQVLGNLLGNAAKFTRRGGSIEVRASVEAGGVVILVRDDGIGIDERHLDRIFDMFAQVDASLEAGCKGLGIGLTLVRSLIGMHGGTVTAHSEGIGRGSTFRIWLPLVVGVPADAVAPAPPPLRSERNAARQCVLIVEDHADAARSMQRLLELLGHEVHVACDGVEGLERAAQLRPQLVLLDIGLPRLNGYEVVRRLRQLPGCQAAVVAAVTGFGQDHDRQRARAAGFDHHLTKPPDPVRLQRLLDDVASRAATREQSTGA